MKQAILSVKDLSVSLYEAHQQALTPVIKNISFELYKKETLGIIGESGSGKSVTLLSIMGLLDALPGVIKGEILFSGGSEAVNLLNGIDEVIEITQRDDGTKTLSKNTDAWAGHLKNNYANVRGGEISVIFQNPKLAFNPYYSIGKQIVEMIRLHTGIKKKSDAQKKAIDWLRRVKMEAPELRFNNNPYGLSGGMCQRAMIALALASEPSILIADEPTTGLDATIQANILSLFEEIKAQSDISMIFVSHDFNVMRRLADRILVYYRGIIVESGTASEIFKPNRKKIHPYTRQLLEARHIKKENDIVSLQHYPAEKAACPFFQMCTLKSYKQVDNCFNKVPPLLLAGDNHFVRCWELQQHG